MRIDRRIASDVITGELVLSGSLQRVIRRVEMCYKGSFLGGREGLIKRWACNDFFYDPTSLLLSYRRIGECTHEFLITNNN